MLDYMPFQSARPIWPKGRETEQNLFVGFRTTFGLNETSQPTVLRLAGSSLYRIWLNGHFVGHGPARAAHGFYWVDKWLLDPYKVVGANLLAVEVQAYNVSGYYLLRQPAFLQAEVVSGGKVLASTGGTGSEFQAIFLPERVQKVERYSLQRSFVEVYRISPGHDIWRKKIHSEVTPTSPEIFAPKRLLPRRVSLPKFERRQPLHIVSYGTVRKELKPEQSQENPSPPQTETARYGFRSDELEETLSHDLQTIGTSQSQSMNEPLTASKALEFAEDMWQILDFGTNLSGFIGCKVTCTQPVTLYLTFDEFLSDGDVDFKRLGCVNAVCYYLQAGEYELETFEPYTLRYLKLIVLGGCARIQGTYLRELANSDVFGAHFSCSDPALNSIFEAGRQTFRQNATDLFMDCPSRERAGWLCDSFFTARVEKDLMGSSRIEKNFLENFLLPQHFDHLPSGMLPMCYPADHEDGNFIPNWAMWFVLQLEEYYARTNDQALVDAARPKILGLLEYFQKFRNRDGLLEKLDRWIFVDWSEANKFVQDVNYPTNMLFSAVLDSVGRMYKDAALCSEANRIRANIAEQSFDGTFFVDNAVRKGGKLVRTTNQTETCQYYAFYFNIASPKTYPELWRILLTQLGPTQQRTELSREIYPANLLIGYYLRMELLSRAGRISQLIDEIKDTFLPMVQRTGTLWEYIDTRASCNHGFASHVVHTLYQNALGCQIDYHRKIIRLQFVDVPLEWCEGLLPLNEGPIYAKWYRQDNAIYYRITAPPAGYSIEIENKSGMELHWSRVEEGCLS